MRPGPCKQMFDAICAPLRPCLNHVALGQCGPSLVAVGPRGASALCWPTRGGHPRHLAAATGDMTMALLKASSSRVPAYPGGRLCAGHAEPRREEIWRAGRRRRLMGRPYAVPLEADALHLPLKSASMDLIVSAFGFRKPGQLRGRASREFQSRFSKPGGQFGHSGLQRAPGACWARPTAVLLRRVFCRPSDGSFPALSQAARPAPNNYCLLRWANFPAPAGHAGPHAGHRLRALRVAALHLRHRPGCTRPSRRAAIAWRAP